MVKTNLLECDLTISPAKNGGFAIYTWHHPTKQRALLAAYSTAEDASEFIDEILHTVERKEAE